MNKLRFSKRLEQFPEYIFSKLSKEVEKVEIETGKKVLNLGPGTPDIAPSKKYIDKLVEYIQDEKAHLYPGYKGIKDFEESLIHWYRERFDVEIKNDEILPLLGGKDGVSHIPLALVDKGNKVLVPNPGYPAYIAPTIIAGAEVEYYDLNEKDNFRISLESIKSKIDRRTKYIWINFPSNPTGATTSITDLEKVVDLCKKRNVIIVYDNAYSEITFSKRKAPSILQIKGAKDIAVEIGSFSKTYSFAGYRIGWIVGNKEIVTALGKLKSQLDSGLSIPLQKLSAYALRNPDKKWGKEMLKSYKDRRDTISILLKKLGLTFELPEGSLYIWARIPEDAKDSIEYCMDLLKKKQILVTPGIAFGSNGGRYVRVSICSNISRINDYV